jgi:hypothetical protein
MMSIQSLADCLSINSSLRTLGIRRQPRPLADSDPGPNAIRKTTIAVSSSRTPDNSICSPTLCHQSSRFRAACRDAPVRRPRSRDQADLRLFLPRHERQFACAYFGTCVRQRARHREPHPRRRANRHGENGWKGMPEEQGFLHEIQAAACQQFKPCWRRAPTSITAITSTLT